MEMERFSGERQQPEADRNLESHMLHATAESASWFSLSNCGAGTAKTHSIYRCRPAITRPTSEQIGASLERQVTKTATRHTHLSCIPGRAPARDARCQRLSSGNLPVWQHHVDRHAARSRTSALSISISPEAVFKQNQFIVNVNARLKPTFSVMGYYNLNCANADTGTASNSYNLTPGLRPRRLHLPQHGLLHGQLHGQVGHLLQSLSGRADRAAPSTWSRHTISPATTRSTSTGRLSRQHRTAPRDKRAISRIPTAASTPRRDQAKA